MEVKGENYHITYNPSAATVTFGGTLRLRGMAEYAPIIQLLDEVVRQGPDTIILDVCQLQFLNSSGINNLFRFVIKVRDQDRSKLIVRGSAQVAWQQKSLQNLQRLMASVQLELS